jgi:hypothetical protein
MNHFINDNTLKVDCEILTKDQIGSILNIKAGKHKKDELLLQLIAHLSGNEVAIRKLYQEYADTLALHPTKLEQILGITPTERKMWTEAKRLPVLEYRYFKKWGKTIEYPVYDRFRVYNITPQIIEKWRQANKEKTHQNRAKGAQRAQQTKKRNESARASFKNEWKKLLASWHKIDPELAATFQLAYWTVWVSRWAKEYQSRAVRAIKNQHEYRAKMDKFYEKKNQAIELLLNPPFKSIAFYRPESPDKITLHLCDYHYEMWRDERSMAGYIDKWNFFNIYKKEILKCGECDYHADRDYYSLFYLKVKDPRIPEFKFSFHTPYPIGKDIFPAINKLPAVEHVEQDGLFRFGRPLFNDEKVIYREHDVLKNFNNAILNFNLYFYG